VDYFYSVYDNFIAIQNSIGNVDGTRPTAQQIVAAAPSRFQSPANPTRVIQIAANVDQKVRTNGAGLSVNYTFSPSLVLSGNYSYNELLTTNFKPGTQSFFNTPKHKFNLGANGQVLTRKLSYTLNYRWVERFLYESTFATGTLPRAQVVDAQLAYTVPSLHTTFQAGGTNLFDSTNYQVYGSPSYGRLVYVGLLFEVR
jgi:outer membrane receptor for ferrienterochelin and colicin